MARQLQARASVAVIEGNVVTVPGDEAPPQGSLRADCTQSGTCAGGGGGVGAAEGLGRLGARLPPVCWVAVLDGLTGSAGAAGAAAAAPTGAWLTGF
jgi:hypothetical protein